MECLEGTRVAALDALRQALQTLPARVPTDVEVVCLVIAPGGTYLYFGACDRALFDPEQGDVEEMIPFDGWEHSDQPLLDRYKQYVLCQDKVPDIDDVFAEMDIWNRESMQLLEEFEPAAAFDLRLVYFSEPRWETLRRYGISVSREETP